MSRSLNRYLSIRIFLVFLLLSLTTIGVGGCDNELSTAVISNNGVQNQQPTPELSTSNSNINTLKVHFIDVGQADSILIQTSDGQSVLVDGGNNDDGTLVVNYLKSQGVKTLDAIVATHPHEDHIGGLDTVIKSFPVSSVYLPNATANTKTFKDFINAIQVSATKRIQAKAGVKLAVDGLDVTFLAPNSTFYDETNNYSAVLKITYKKTSFLLTGDAEALSEDEVLKQGFDVKSTVLKVGHHGSNSSTSESFLNAVSPKYAVISVGLDNDYGHPASKTLVKLASSGVQVLRTDISGTLIATSDGNIVSFDKQVQPAPTTTDSSTPTSSSSGVKISNIDLRHEIVTLVNTGSSPIDLSGWKLVSEIGSQSFTFPSGTIIAAGGTLKVSSGRNAQRRDGELLWSKDNIWNNDGDPGILYDSEENIIAKYH